MSKHKKLSKNENKYQYTKNEFIRVVCNKCGLCKPTNPEFCYESVYKDNPKKTIKVVLDQLIVVKSWLLNSGYTINTCPDEYVKYTLQNAFCSSNFCGQLPKDDHQCKSIDGCLYSFKRQINNNNNCNNVIDFNSFKTKHKQKKKLKRIIYLPTFFCNEGFRNEIKEILDGNNS